MFSSIRGDRSLEADLPTMRCRSFQIEAYHNSRDWTGSQAQRLIVNHLELDRDGPTSPDRVTKPASPYIVAGQEPVISAEHLIAGLRSRVCGTPDHRAGDRGRFHDTPTGRSAAGDPQGARFDAAATISQSRVWASPRSLTMVWTTAHSPERTRSSLLERQPGADAAEQCRILRTRGRLDRWR